jgi:hypothetical protein
MSDQSTEPEGGIRHVTRNPFPIDEPPVPLADHEAARMNELISLPTRTPEQHSELQDLWQKAKDYAAGWKADPELMHQHLMSFADSVMVSLRQIATLIPAAAGISSIVARADAALHSFKLAAEPPPELPELPPAPEPEPAPAPPAPEPSPVPPAPPSYVPPTPEPPMPAAPARHEDPLPGEGPKPGA